MLAAALAAAANSIFMALSLLDGWENVKKNPSAITIVAVKC